MRIQFAIIAAGWRYLVLVFNLLSINLNPWDIHKPREQLRPHEGEGVSQLTILFNKSNHKGGGGGQKYPKI